MSDKIVTEVARDHLAVDIANMIDRWYDTLPTAETTPMPPPTVPPKTGWNVGVWSQHDRAQAEAWFQWIGRGPGRTRSHVTMFVTHDKNEAAMTNDWWTRAPYGIPPGRGLSLRIPLVPGGDTDLKKDRSATFRTIARQAAAIDPNALICPGWEMNLPGWPHKVTAGNLDAWRAAWTRCYDVMKAEAPGLIIGFNPNGGDLGQTGVDIRKAWVEGKVDAAGPDQYDCWPGDLDTATRSQMLDRPGGLQWWADLTKAQRVPLIVPEWGVSSGTQWRGHTGGDSSRYIQFMFDFFKRTPHLSHESYFNEPAPYVASDIFRVGGARPSNPKAGLSYQELWRDLP
jgi:hypothetical protein